MLIPMHVQRIIERRLHELGRPDLLDRRVVIRRCWRRGWRRRRRGNHWRNGCRRPLARRYRDVAERSRRVQLVEGHRSQGSTAAPWNARLRVVVEPRQVPRRSVDGSPIWPRAHLRDQTLVRKDANGLRTAVEDIR
jgi:hypothetical protein